MQFLVSVPSFEDLDRSDDIQVAVPSFGASISVSAWQTTEVPHSFELEKVWLHLEGCHILFATFWACGLLDLSLGRLLMLIC
jgi:hypothetical protein